MKKQSTNNRIILIGFRGTGKTTIGKKLSGLLNWQYISTDHEITKRTGMAIMEYVKKNGWDEFRQIESEVVDRLKEKTETVIDCGGGVVEDDSNMKNLQQGSLVVWVDAELSDIYRRLTNAGDRPLLNQSDLMKDIKFNYERREPLYLSFAEIKVNSSLQPTNEICNKILNKLKE